MATASICVDCTQVFEQWSAVGLRQGSTGIRCRPCHRAHVKARPSYQAKHQSRQAATNPRNDQRLKVLRAQVMAEESTCGFCGEEVDKTLHYQHKMSPCIDHITPVALGGAWFERSNVRLAHRSCNSKAGNRAHQDDALEKLAFSRAALWLADRLAA